MFNTLNLTMHLNTQQTGLDKELKTYQCSGLDKAF